MGEISQKGKYKMKEVVERTFVAGHRLVGHEKCSTPHGHNYRAKVTITGDVNDNGMLVDIGKVKDIIDDLDHEWLGECVIKVGDKTYSPFMDVRPTVENIAGMLREMIASTGTNIDEVKVELWETKDAKVILQ